MKILNLYAGIGGNRKLWGDEHEITAVEFEPYIAEAYKKMYPNDTVIIADAHQYLLDHHKEYDFIWSSPPCPSHSRIRTMQKKMLFPDMSLYQEIIFLKHFFKGNWVVENVIPYYDPLIKQTIELDRHLFWSNKDIGGMLFSRNFTGSVTMATKETLSDYHGIKIPEGTKDQRKLLRNAVHPDLGNYIFEEINRD